MNLKHLNTEVINMVSLHDMIEDKRQGAEGKHSLKLTKRHISLVSL